MPWLGDALDPNTFEQQLRAHLPEFLARHRDIAVASARLVRHKPGRRCLIEYQLELGDRGDVPERLTVLGKVRARGLDTRSYRVQHALWSADFGDRSADGISVPEPLGTIPPLRMWLQRKVPGTSPLGLLAGPEGRACATRIAAAAHKLHAAGVPAGRRHTMVDELRIIHERLGMLATTMPRWERQLDRVVRACGGLAADVPPPLWCGIHRDLYADQIVVAGERMYLVDFDLFCEGDPGLDIGNFLGHLVEHGLRTPRDRDALAERHAELEEHFVELAGTATRAAIRAYTTLTLVRLVHISTLFPDRLPFTEPLLELCATRLSRPARTQVFA